MMFSATEAGECVILEGNPCREAQGCTFTWTFFSSLPAGPYGWDEAEVGYGLPKPTYSPGTRPWVSNFGTTYEPTGMGSQNTTSVSCGHYTYIQAKPQGQTSYASATLKCTGCFLVDPNEG